MADKNLHDIKLDELENKKKNPLKNILTLLALLFIILVISVVITKLILNTDEGKEIDANSSTGISPITAGATAAGATAAAIAGKHLLDSGKNESGNAKDIDSDTKKKEEAKKAADAKKNATSTTERNITSAIKVPLRTHPVKTATETAKIASTGKKETSKPKTYKVPKKHTADKKVTTSKAKTYKVPKKHVATKKTTSKHTTSKHTSSKKVTKRYVDKVIAKKKTTSKTKSTSHYRNKLLAGYYIKVGTFKDVSRAVKNVKRKGLKYSLIKTKNDKTLVRVLVGPYKSHSSAKKHLATVKHISAGAYITKVK